MAVHAHDRHGGLVYSPRGGELPRPGLSGCGTERVIRRRGYSCGRPCREASTGIVSENPAPRGSPTSKLEGALEAAEAGCSAVPGPL